MSAGNRGRGLAPPPVNADVGIVAALKMEIDPFLKRLSMVRRYVGPKHTIIEGRCAGRIVVATITGPGRLKAQRGAEALMAGHRPRWIVSPGYAGALDVRLNRNDLFIPREVVNVEGNRFPIDSLILEASQQIALHFGTLLTGDEIVRTAAEKAALREKYQADVVDMETSAVAAICAERQVRFLSIRVVSDDARSDLPPEIHTLLGPSGGYRVGAAAALIWNKPSNLKTLLTMREHGLKAAEKLCAYLWASVSRL